MKHTAGPWECGRFYYPENGKIGTCEITPYGEFGIVAHVYLPVKGRPAHREGEPNARLIAAAPEMLAALKECVEVYGWMDDDVTPPRVLRARAVIAKAETA